MIDAEPALTIGLTDAEGATDALLAIAEFVDLKSPFMLGHSTAVAELAAAAERQLGLGDDDVKTAAPSRAGPRVRPARRLELDLGQARPARCR